MIRLEPIRLTRRNALTQAGPEMDFGIVLILAQLDAKTLYTAAKIAAGAYDPDNQSQKYQSVRRSVYEFGKRHHLKKYPDNLDAAGNLIDENGKPITRPAMWTGESWQSHINDLLWNRAADLFEQVSSMETRRLAANLPQPRYWYDPAGESVIQQPAQITKQESTPQQETTRTIGPPPPAKEETLRLQAKQTERWDRKFAIPIFALAALLVSALLLPQSGKEPKATPHYSRTQAGDVAAFLEQRWNQTNKPIYAYLGDPPGWSQHAASWKGQPVPSETGNPKGGGSFSVFSFITNHSRPTESLLERTSW